MIDAILETKMKTAHKTADKTADMAGERWIVFMTTLLLLRYKQRRTRYEQSVQIAIKTKTLTFCACRRGNSLGCVRRRQRKGIARIVVSKLTKILGSVGSRLRTIVSKGHLEIQSSNYSLLSRRTADY